MRTTDIVALVTTLFLTFAEAGVDADDARVKIPCTEETISNVLQSDTATADSDVMQATGEEMQARAILLRTSVSLSRYVVDLIIKCER